MNVELKYKSPLFASLLESGNEAIAGASAKDMSSLFAQIVKYADEIDFMANKDMLYSYLLFSSTYLRKCGSFKQIQSLLESNLFNISNLDDSQYIDIMRFLAEVYFVNGRFKAANWALAQMEDRCAKEKPDIFVRACFIKAQLLLATGKYSEAMSLCKDNLNIALQTDDSALKAEAWLNYSLSFRHQGDHENAFDAISKACDLLDYSSDLELLVKVLSQKGIAECYRAKTAQGFETLNDALQKSQTLENKTIRIQVLFNLGTAYEFDNNFMLAFDAYRQAIELSVKSENEYLFALSMNNFANILLEFNEFEQAYKLYLHALKIFQKLEIYRGIMLTYNNMGNYYFYKSDFKEAINYYEKALSLEIKLHDNYGMANSYNNLGNAFQKLGNLRSAFRYYVKTLELLQTINDEVMLAAILNNLGNLKLEIGNLVKAREFYEKALKINQKKLISDAIAMNFSNLAQVAQRQGDLSRALEYYEKAILFDSKIGKKYNVINHYENMIAILLETSQYADAEVILEKALQLAESIKDQQSQAGLQFQYAKLAGYKLQHERAMYYYSAAADIYTSDQNFTAAAECYFNLANLLYELHYSDLAIKYLKKSSELFNIDQNWDELFDAEYFISKIYFERSEFTHALFHLAIADQISSDYLAEDSKIKQLIQSIKAHVQHTGKN